jgi:ribose-phosphate pyrophosphokinase
MNRTRVALFAINTSRAFGQRVADSLDVPLSAHEEREFDDGEHKIRPLDNVRGRDVYVIHSLYSDRQQTVNDKLCRLLFFVGALNDASAGRVTAVVPYLAYARKDRRTQPRDPVTIRYVAQLIEAVGADRIVTLDVHNLGAYQNAFRIPADHLEANLRFVDYVASVLRNDEPVAVVSPDVGGVKRAERFRAALERTVRRDVPLGFMEKARAKGVMTAGELYGDVRGRTVVILDDMISTGGTLAHAAAACHARGATRVFAAASHGVFTGRANETLATAALERVIVTDTVPPLRLDPELVTRRLVTLPASELFAQAIARMHTGGSLVDLMSG